MSERSENNKNNKNNDIKITFDDTIKWVENEEKHRSNYIHKFSQKRIESNTLLYLTIGAIAIIAIIVFIFIMTGDKDKDILKNGQALNEMRKNYDIIDNNNNNNNINGGFIYDNPYEFDNLNGSQNNQYYPQQYNYQNPQNIGNNNT